MIKKQPSRFSRASFRVIRSLIRLFYGKIEVVGADTLPKEHAIIVGNHSQLHGPLVGELFLSPDIHIWCAGQMMELRDVPAYAFSDFWSQKPKWTHPFYRVLSYLITPLSVCLFTNAKTVAVYHDSRVISTFKETVRLLSEQKNILIFPEKDEKLNNILYRFQENFVDVAKLYYKKTGVELTFYPLYVAPKLRKAFVGKGVRFDASADIAQERKRIVSYLTEEITSFARSLPRHTVIPYRNVPKKHYLTNQDVTEVSK